MRQGLGRGRGSGRISAAEGGAGSSMGSAPSVSAEAGAMSGRGSGYDGLLALDCLLQVLEMALHALQQAVVEGACHLCAAA